LQRRIFFLLFLIAGVLLFQSVQAQTLVDANAQPKPAPTGTQFANGADPTVIDESIFLARNGGTITGQGDLTLNVVPANGNQVLNAVGPGSRIEMTVGTTVINMTNSPNGPTDNNRGAYANLGGTVILTNSTIKSAGAGSAVGRNNRAGPNGNLNGKGANTVHDSSQHIRQPDRIRSAEKILKSHANYNTKPLLDLF
jgi:hypothetical protein